MKRNNQNQEKELLNRYSNFSEKMVKNHHLSNLSEFVLHDICDQNLFGVSKAAYLVNNPDFTCLKGVVGYHHPESYQAGASWDNQKDFMSHMKNSQFNNQVRSIYEQSLSEDYQDKVYLLADRLKISDPKFHIWDLKHNNQGLLIFQNSENGNFDQDHLTKFLYMLSFCPVF